MTVRLSLNYHSIVNRFIYEKGYYNSQMRMENKKAS